MRLFNLKRDDQGHAFLFSEFFVDTDDLDFEGIFDSDMDILKDDVVHRYGQVRRKGEGQRILIGLALL